jgi:hypothetical protein
MDMINDLSIFNKNSRIQGWMASFKIRIVVLKLADLFRLTNCPKHLSYAYIKQGGDSLLRLE